MTSGVVVEGAVRVMTIEGVRDAAAGEGGARIPAVGVVAAASAVAMETLELPGAEDLSLASRLNQLARQYREQGEDGKAEPLLERALVIEETTLGPAHPQVAITLTDLMYLYRRQGRETAAAAAAARATGILSAHARQGCAA